MMCMARRLRQFAVVAASGAIGPWLVGASLAALASPPPPSRWPLHPDSLSAWMMARLPSTWSSYAYIGKPMTASDERGVSSMVSAGWWQPDADETCSAEFLVVMAGWPLRCVVGAAAAVGYGVQSDDSCLRGIVGLDGLVFLAAPMPGHSPIDQARVIPLGLLTKEYILNGLVYAALMVGVLNVSILPRIAIARWRRARGRCETCGYVVHSAPAGRCPECGTRRDALLR
jgi:hypothetical protein